VLLSDLRTLHYHMGDIHDLTPMIRGDMTFQKQLTVKPTLGKLHTCRLSYEEYSLLEVWSNPIPINFEKITD
jgi:hypothetical protein